MTLKFSDRPQLNYGGNQGTANWSGRYPANMQPLTTCPDTAVIVVSRNGHQRYAIQRNGIIKNLDSYKDWKTGQVAWREDGTYASDAIGWLPIKRG